MQFIPSKYKLSKEKFGELVNGTIPKKRDSWLGNSLILNEDERLSLSQMVKVSDGKLLYRASRDGFTASAFHSRCDRKANTVTIIKTNSNYVFGGYTAAEWGANNNSSISDSSAFLFSLRRNGTSNNQKLPIIRAEYAIYGGPGYGPTFGGGHDIYIADRSDTQVGSYSNLDHSYQCPTGYSYGKENIKCFLAGTYNGWLTTEIEVYQLC